MSARILFKSFLVGLAFALLFFAASCIDQKNMILSIDFESKDFSQWRNACGKCFFSLGNGQYIERDPKGVNGFSGVYSGGKKRNESASSFLPLDTDLKIEFSLLFDENFDVESKGTVAQVIGWQKGCFEGGMFHLRYEKGRWGYWMRNLDAGHDYISDIKIPKGEWIDVVVDAKFSSKKDGYFFTEIKQGDKTIKYDIIENSATFKNCPRGPYIKAGLYGDYKERDLLYVDNVRVSFSRPVK